MGPFSFKIILNFMVLIFSKFFFGLFLILMFFVLGGGCGVKGDPLPPLTPAELGRGAPTYKGATEELAYPQIPPLDKIESKDDFNDNDNDNDNEIEDEKDKELEDI